ncbi:MULTISPECIES: hypothetical protein [Bradyrhizobium]|uniref:hypothetical protein n=1 Tax=Bradyrhizobium elkanii TaxID=29448 RepID=UPI00040EE876|nr:hypothetical protein [Bradyrhizobium elkanii]
MDRRTFLTGASAVAISISISFTAAIAKGDIYDGAEWTEMDIVDLKASLEHGSTIEEASEFLCRSGSIDDVARKAAELGLPVIWRG